MNVSRPFRDGNDVAVNGEYIMENEELGGYSKRNVSAAPNYICTCRPYSQTHRTMSNNLRIGCVIQHCGLQRGITQPIL